MSSTAKDIDGTDSKNYVNIYGDDRDNIIYASNGGGNIYGDKGDDTIYAGEGTNAIYGGEGNDTLYSGGYNYTYFYYNKGDGDDTIYDLKNWDYVSTNDCSVKSTKINGKDVVITVAAGVNLDRNIGNITLKNAVGVTFYLNGENKTFGDTNNNNFIEKNNVEERWFMEGDDNFTTSEVSTILNSNKNISGNYSLEKELQFPQDSEIIPLTHNQTNHSENK